MRIVLLVLLIVALFIAGVYLQLWLWRVALMPVAPMLRLPTFWQMAGIDLLFAGIVAGGSRK